MRAARRSMQSAAATVETTRENMAKIWVIDKVFFMNGGYVTYHDFTNKLYLLMLHAFVHKTY